MILTDFNDFPRTGRLLGIDWGTKRIGLAISDPAQDFVFTRPAIKEWNPNIIADENISGIVLGLPLCTDGTDSETTRKVRDFANALSEQTDAPIIMLDETLTSFEAQTAQVTDIDSESAKIILENAIAIMRRG